MIPTVPTGYVPRRVQVQAEQQAKQASPWDTQVGGTHYTKCGIQPFEYSMRNGLDPMQHTVVKYVTRFRDKGGIADLEKAKHTIDLLIQFERARGAK